MGQPAKVDVEAPVPLKRSPTLRTRDTVGLRDALLARKAKKLQATRLGFLFLYITILLGVWILALRHNRISLSRPLGVVLKGCDLVVKRGSEAKVRLKTHLSSAASASIQMRSGKLERITATNSLPGGCDESPGQRCAPICKLTVELPSSKEIIRLDVDQDAADEADHVKVVLKDVRIKDCRVNGPRVELVVKDTVHESILKAQLESGTIRASNVKGGALFLKSARGNIYVDDVSQDSWDLNWRAGSSQACFETFGSNARNALSIDYSGRTVDNVWTPKQVFSNSTTGSWWTDCNPQSLWWKTQVFANYDGDTDGRITKDEFREGYEKLGRCCGGGCPQWSWCGVLEDEMFPTVDTAGTLLMGPNVITQRQILDKLESMGDTTLIPGCHRVATVEDSTTRRSVTLWSDTGEVKFMRNVGGNVDRTTSDHGIFRDTGQVEGLRLAKYDSDALISEIRDVYGANDAEGDVLVVIDVVSSPGVPEQRWIYATRKIFLEIDPPTLHLLSLGLLVPDMKRYRVHFTNGVCGNHNTTDVKAATLEIYSQLYQALVPRFQQSGLRGMLVRLERQKRRTLPALGKMWAYPSRIGTLTGANQPTEPYETPYNKVKQGTPRTALVFSAALGVFVAIFSTLALIKIATILVDNHERKQQVRHQMEAAKQLAALGASEREIKAALRPPPKKPKQRGWKRFLQVPKNPLAKPLRLFTIFVQQPLKRYYVNSVKAFVQAECLLRPVRGIQVVVEDKPLEEGAAPAPAPGEQLRSIHAHQIPENNHNVMLFDLNSCSLENFEFHYGKFCQKEDLKPFLKEELQAELASRFDCRFKRVRMPQISGLKWKDCTLHDLDAFRERKLKITASLDECGGIGGAASLNIDRAMIARFLREECLVTGHNQIDQIQTFDRRRRDEDGCEQRIYLAAPSTRRLLTGRSIAGHKGVAAGLYSRFYDWICVQNPAAQQVSEDDVRTACRKIVRGDPEALLEQVGPGLVFSVEGVVFAHGLTLKDAGRDKRAVGVISRDEYKREALLVLGHLAFLFSFPCLVLATLFKTQFMYAEALSVRRALSKYDLTWPMKEDREINATCKYLGSFCLAYMALALLRLICNYAFATKGSKGPMKYVTLVSMWLFGFASTLMVLGFIAYCAILACWILVAAVMKPSEYLKYAAAAALIIFVITTSWKQMAATAKTMKETITRVMDRTLNESAKKAHEKLTREKMSKQAVAEGAAVGVAAGGVAAGLRQRKGADPEEDVEAGDDDAPFEIERIFDLVDEDESNNLCREELRELFYLMEISISEEQLETIFAYADADGSGSIDMGEFRSAWARIQEEMVAAVMEQVGLSTTQIILFVACVTIAVCALFAFIFLAIGAWHDADGAFIAVVQSTFIAGSGFVTQMAAARKSSDDDTEKAEEMAEESLKDD